MPTHVRHPQISSVRRQFGGLTLAAVLLVAPVLAGAQQTVESQPPASSSVPMDHAHKGHTNAHAGMAMTGDVDYDFAFNMRKHHQMALVMAEAQLKNGKDAKLRAMATEIIAAQDKEIAELDRWLATRDQPRTSQNAD
jgi:uncharacterized protein (DUF305 family)